MLAFLVGLLAEAVKSLGMLPPALDRLVPDNPFCAVYQAFILLLLAEVIGLVFGLGKSVADTVGIQFEILSLILLRDVFGQLADPDATVSWRLIREHIGAMAVDAGAALVIFAAVGVYYRVQRHAPLTADEQDRVRFVRAKKCLALSLLVFFAVFGGRDLYVQTTALLFESQSFGEWWRTQKGVFFSDLFTILIFADVLIVLLTFLYSSTYHVAFRNSGFAIATLFIRVALLAEPEEVPYLRAGLSVGAAAYAILLTLAFNNFGRAPAELSPLPDSKRSPEPGEGGGDEVLALREEVERLQSRISSLIDSRQEASSARPL